MTTCPYRGYACTCQPQEGIECSATPEEMRSRIDALRAALAVQFEPLSDEQIEKGGLECGVFQPQTMTLDDAFWDGVKFAERAHRIKP
jgi:hypothetical protein